MIISLSPYVGSFNPINILGLSYAFLKFIDLLYYAYYHEEKISFIDCVNFILFIPVFTSGPILDFPEFIKELNSQIPPLELETPTIRIIKGFFKKVVLVRIFYYMHDVILSGSLNPFTSFLVLFLFYIIGYLDFSGYSDIAIGFSLILGIKAPENFKNPFNSPSLTVFWRNWHMSLGAWVKKHVSVFIKPKNRFQSGLSSFIIMVFIGLWHKFTPLFLLWGVWHGIFLFLEGYLNKGIVNKKKTPRHIYFFRCVLTNIIVALGCIFFYTDINTVVKILRGFVFFLAK